MTISISEKLTAAVSVCSLPISDPQFDIWNTVDRLWTFSAYYGIVNASGFCVSRYVPIHYQSSTLPVLENVDVVGQRKCTVSNHCDTGMYMTNYAQKYSFWPSTMHRFPDPGTVFSRQLPVAQQLSSLSEASQRGQWSISFCTNSYASETMQRHRRPFNVHYVQD